MLERLQWVINRLRLMSVPEITYRVCQVFLQSIERFRLGYGWVPQAPLPDQTSRPLFAHADLHTVCKQWHESFQINEQKLHALMQGKVSFFSNEYDIGVTPNWHRDPDSQRISPITYGKTINYRNEEIVGNIKTLWEVGRHQHLLPLAVAYAITGKIEYRNAVTTHIHSWIDQCPYGMGIHWCSSLEVALRVIAWCMAHSIIAIRDGPCGILAADDETHSIARSLFQHGYFIRHQLSRFSSANNHLIGELVGLYCLTCIFDFSALGKKWNIFAKSSLEQELDAQIFADGVVKEQAVHYQLEVLEYYLFAWCISTQSDVPMTKAVSSRILAMAGFVRSLIPSGGNDPPQIGDSDEGTVNRFRPELLTNVADEALSCVDHAFTGEPDKPRWEKAFWYRLIRVGQSVHVQLADQPARLPAKVFPDGGYAVLSSGSIHVVFDAGPLGYPSIAAHGHADALSVCAAWGGYWWLIDPGTYAYHGDQFLRNYFRGTSAHNTATINGMDQSELGGPFMWTRAAKARLVGAGEEAGTGATWAEGYHNGYQSLGIRHHRRIECESPGPECGSLKLIDSFECSDARHSQSSIDLHLHFPPDVHVTLSTHQSASQCIATRPESSVELTITLDPSAQWQAFRGSKDPLLGWYSSGLGQIQPATTIRGSLNLRQRPIQTLLSFTQTKS